MQLLKKWKEILLGSVVIIIVLMVCSLIKNLFVEQSNKMLAYNEIKQNCDKIKNGETSEEKLKGKLEELKIAYSGLETFFPAEIKKQDVNKAIVDIASKSKLEGITIANSSLTDESGGKDSKYSGVRVAIKGLSGSYENFKDFLNLIKEYDKKVVVKSLTFSKNDKEGKYTGSVTMVFYGETES